MRHRHALRFLAMLAPSAAFAQPAPQALPTGQMLTPLAAPGASFAPLRSGIGPFPDYVADGAAAIAASPDGRQLLVLTSGFNRFNRPDGAIDPAQSGQYVFVYDISSTGARLQQTLMLPNSFSGIAWRPDGGGFAVGGGAEDSVRLYRRGASGFAIDGDPIKLDHKAGNGTDVQPQAAGVAISPDGKRLLVANYYNDSISLIDLATRAVVAEQDLRPGKIDASMRGQAGGEYPLFPVWRDAVHAYVSSPRDRQILALNIGDRTISVASRIATLGEPTALLYDQGHGRLYATEDNADRMAIVDARRDVLLAEPRLGFPAGVAQGGLGKGLNANSLTMTPDYRLLVTYGGANALAIVTPGDTDVRVVGLVPTGWYPSAAAVSADGARVFVVNRKSPPGPNPLGCAPKLAAVKTQSNACGGANQYIFQLEKAGLLQFPMPTPAALVKTTLQVARNIGLPQDAARTAAARKMAAVRARIKHVIFIVKENRTYDQVLGDLEVGNGDPALAILGARLTPNHHDLARRFVTLDNFYDSGEQSSTGWTWTTAGRVPDLLEKTAPVNYARRGLSYESEGLNRNIAPAMSFADRRRVDPSSPADADVLPGPATLTGPDADDDKLTGQGFIWNAAIRAGLSVRNYGFADASVYEEGKPGFVPPIRDPFKDRRKVWSPADRDLASRSDLYFRGFDQKLPDYWRVLEWFREFDRQAATNTVPALTLLRLSHDHFGDFELAVDRVNTVETQIADNDYALGMVVERVAKSKAAGSTLIFVIEDDAQNGADHVDARRSIAYVVGPYVRQGALVSTRYTTVSMLRTIEDVLGVKPMGLNDTLATPMADVFDPAASKWSYTAHAADVLRTTALPIPPAAYALPRQAAACASRSSAWWSAAMKGQDFSSEDRLDTAAFNRALWAGLGTGAMPEARSGADLRSGRAALIGGGTACPAAEGGAATGR